MNQEDTDAIRKDREARINRVYEAFAKSKDFEVFFEDLDAHFPFFKASFQSSDGHNSHAAAKRDGNKEVLAHIHKNILKARQSKDEDIPTKPTEAL